MDAITVSNAGARRLDRTLVCTLVRGMARLLPGAKAEAAPTSMARARTTPENFMAVVCWCEIIGGVCQRGGGTTVTAGAGNAGMQAAGRAFAAPASRRAASRDSASDQWPPPQVVAGRSDARAVGLRRVVLRRAAGAQSPPLWRWRRAPLVAPRRTAPAARPPRPGRPLASTPPLPLLQQSRLMLLWC